MMKSVATVTVANSNKGLTTLDRVKAELGITGNGSDALLGAKILEASSDIEGHLNRTLRKETISEVFWGLRGCAEALIFSRNPVGTITSVTLDDELIDADNYRLDPEAGLLYRLSDGSPSSWSFGKATTVIYQAGYDMPVDITNTGDLPPALQAACVELVASYWASRGRDPTVREEDVQGVMRTVYWVGAVGDAGELPPSVESKIGTFRRMALA